ncbi:Fic family protein [Empedobacter falsenii]
MKSLINKYEELGIEKTIDHDKFNLISVVHHSTVLEGSTLTEIESSVLINDGLTPKGKPLEHSLMVTDHYKALIYVIEQANKKTPISVELIKNIGELVLKNTGSVYETILGTVDASKGEFRKGNVMAGATYFPNYDKVERLMNDLVSTIQNKMKTNLSIEDQVNLSFDAHFNMVSIHPFYDGNGRSSRLLMNYIQQYYNLPLAIVNSESKVDYIEALIDTREKEDISIFRHFMKQEYSTQLKEEIQNFEKISKPNKGLGFKFLF